MKNVEMNLEGNILTIKVDLSMMYQNSQTCQKANLINNV